MSSYHRRSDEESRRPREDRDYLLRRESEPYRRDYDSGRDRSQHYEQDRSRLPSRDRTRLRNRSGEWERDLTSEDDHRGRSQDRSKSTGRRTVDKMSGPLTRSRSPESRRGSWQHEESASRPSRASAPSSPRNHSRPPAQGTRTAPRPPSQIPPKQFTSATPAHHPTANTMTSSNPPRDPRLLARINTTTPIGVRNPSNTPTLKSPQSLAVKSDRPLKEASPARAATSKISGGKSGTHDIPEAPLVKSTSLGMVGTSLNVTGEGQHNSSAQKCMERLISSLANLVEHAASVGQLKTHHAAISRKAERNTALDQKNRDHYKHFPALAEKSLLAKKATDRELETVNHKLAEHSNITNELARDIAGNFLSDVGAEVTANLDQGVRSRLSYCESQLDILRTSVEDLSNKLSKKADVAFEKRSESISSSTSETLMTASRRLDELTAYAMRLQWQADKTRQDLDSVRKEQSKLLSKFAGSESLESDLKDHEVRTARLSDSLDARYKELRELFSSRLSTEEFAISAKAFVEQIKGLQAEFDRLRVDIQENVVTTTSVPKKTDVGSLESGRLQAQSTECCPQESQPVYAKDGPEAEHVPDASDVDGLKARVQHLEHNQQGLRNDMTMLDEVLECLKTTQDDRDEKVAKEVDSIILRIHSAEESLGQLSVKLEKLGKVKVDVQATQQEPVRLAKSAEPTPPLRPSPSSASPIPRIKNSAASRPQSGLSPAPETVALLSRLSDTERTLKRVWDLVHFHANALGAHEHSVQALNSRFNALSTERMARMVVHEMSETFPYAANTQAEIASIRSELVNLQALSTSMDLLNSRVERQERELTRIDSNFQNLTCDLAAFNPLHIKYDLLDSQIKEHAKDIFKLNEKVSEAEEDRGTSERKRAQLLDHVKEERDKLKEHTKEEIQNLTKSIKEQHTELNNLFESQHELLKRDIQSRCDVLNGSLSTLQEPLKQHVKSTAVSETDAVLDERSASHSRNGSSAVNRTPLREILAEPKKQANGSPAEESERNDLLKRFTEPKSNGSDTSRPRKRREGSPRGPAISRQVLKKPRKPQSIANPEAVVDLTALTTTKTLSKRKRSLSA